MIICPVCGKKASPAPRARCCSPKCGLILRRKEFPPSKLFWEKVEVKTPEVCWPWIGKSKANFGYGMFRLNGRVHNAHHAAWLLTNGPIEAGLFVLHKCDNPPCCNPAHLFLGTQKDNMIDKSNKGRADYPKGEQHPRAKVTDQDVKAIRAAPRSYGARRRLAAQYGISKETVDSITERKTWKHVK